MAQQERPPRSLRKGGEAPKYYRDWSAAEQYLDASENEPEDDILEAQEMNMVAGMDVEEDDDDEPMPTAETSSEIKPPMGPLPELKVIVPDAPVTEMPKQEPKKPTITRVKPRVQRARRRSEIEAEEKAQEEAERKKRELENQFEKPQRFKPREGPDTTAVQENIKNITDKVDQTRENVKNTAENISENIKQVSDKLTDSMVSGVKKFSGGLVGLINKFGQKPRSAPAPSSHFSEEDFEDDPIPQAAEQPSSQSAPASTSAPATEPSLLDKVSDIAPVEYVPLYYKSIRFLTFDKQPLVPEGLDDEGINRAFFDNAITDLKKCLKVVQKLPDPKEGPYQGIPIVYIFKHVRPDDLRFFLHYVHQKPKTFVDKNLKISEAFATWLIKRSHKTIVVAPFPDVPAISYVPLYKKNIRFLTLQKRQMVLATGKSPQEIDTLFIKHAIQDVRACVDLVKKFPPAEQGPYKGRPLGHVFKHCAAKDIYFFLHYISQEPDIFQGQNFKFSEAFASWVLQHSHETQFN